MANNRSSPIGIGRQAVRRGTFRHLGAALTVALVAGCAGVVAAPLPSPAEIPALEEALSRAPGDPATLIRLGVAYREAGRLDDARGTLEAALERAPTDPAAVFYLGLAYEDLGLPESARALYARYIEVGTRDDLKRLLSNRIPMLERQALMLAVRDAAAREAELADTPPRPNTVAVLPFVYAGADPQYRPLSRALAEMLVTDLSQTDRLQVLERTRLQLLVDEMALASEDLVDAETAARPGRLVGAERLIQGQVNVNDADLRLDAAVIGSETGELAGAPIWEQDALPRLFEMEKRLALNLYTALGVQLSPAERERVTRIPTENIQALLAFGECLEAEDAGAYEEAAGHCSRAATIDPSFDQARDRAERIGTIAAAVNIVPRELASRGAPEIDPPPGGADDPLTSFDAIQAIVPPELPRAPVPEALGTDGGRSTVLDIIIRRP